MRPTPGELRREMDGALKAAVLPQLRARGFRGSFPHLRRAGADAIDLLTFQFDRNGGGFLVEIARAPLAGVRTTWGAEIAPSRVSAWDVHPGRRKRIQLASGGGTDSWFRFDTDAIATVVAQVLEKLADDAIWDELGPPGSPDQQSLPP